MAEPIARSPIPVAGYATLYRGWEASTAPKPATLHIVDLSPLAKILVRSNQRVLDVPYGKARRDNRDVLVVGSAPMEWLLLGHIGEANDITRHIPTHGFTIVADITHGRALMRVTGADARLMLAKVCSVDLGDDMAPQGAAFRTPIAGVVTDVVRDDQEKQLSYLLHCERSTGQHLFESLLEAGAEFGIGVAGLGSRP